MSAIACPQQPNDNQEHACISIGRNNNRCGDGGRGGDDQILNSNLVSENRAIDVNRRRRNVKTDTKNLAKSIIPVSCCRLLRR